MTNHSRRSFFKLPLPLVCGFSAISSLRAELEQLKIRYVLSSAMYGEMKLDDILPEVSKAGCEAIDIWCKVHGNQREQISEMGYARAKDLFDKYKVKGVVIPKQDDSKLMPYIYSLTKLALCKSGTVNMELALYGIPQIIGYRVSRVTAFIAKRILNFKVRFISPVNLLMKKFIIPEFVQKNFNEKKIFYKACRLLDLSSEKAKIKKGYILLKKELGEEGVVERAAKEIINSII